MTPRRRLSHDIRNSMNAIKLLTECLRVCEGEEYLESLDAIETACDKLVAAVEAIGNLADDAPSDANA